jgi:hypothetical protein
MAADLKADVRRLEARMRDQETWSAQHDGRINTLWDNQTDLNKALKVSMENLADRTAFLERRFTWSVGFVSAAASIGGTLAGSLVTIGLALYFNG